AFFNLDQRCMYNCKFCTSPLLEKDLTKSLTDDKIVGMIRDRMREQKILSAAVTSGVVGSVRETVDNIVSCVTAIRKEFPDMPIGVEPYIDSVDQIVALKDAGATEMKINLETPREDIFKKVCPELDYSLIIEMLKESVKVFGAGKVTTNLILGMGETDDDVIECMDMLASFGCVPGLRAIRLNERNARNMKAIGISERVDRDRTIRLAHAQKEILSRYGLTTLTFRTMCFECGCCDLVPFRDL
ncbi:MAG: radical SAM protein, partial [Methanomassiliicoccaceae archaeon]|nr:radical SAM protein [Methanomassiliicoccaceae archaeon]